MVTFKLPPRQNFIMSIRDKFRGNTFVQATINGRQLKKIGAGDNIRKDFEIVGHPKDNSIVKVVAQNGNDYYAPEVWISSGYPWDGVAPEVTKDHRQL